VDKAIDMEVADKDEEILVQRETGGENGTVGKVI
jgi:hypothetical protein